jgi:hypothetical protein
MRACRLLFLLLLLLPMAHVSALDTDLRLKLFSTGSALPEQDVQRLLDGTPSYDHTLDLRTMLRHDAGKVHVLLDHSLVWLGGDGIALGRGPNVVVDQTVTDDDRRWVDLTWQIDDGKRHTSFHRLDRLALQWQPGNWNFTLGRQAVSWGSGIVFQPLDLFSPFSPTVVDRDYKGGEDLLLVDRLLDNGHDLQLLHVIRRDDERHVTSEVSSTAFKWHGFAGIFEFEVLAAEHYDERVVGVSLRVPVGQALVRSDIVANKYESTGGDDSWRYSGILNLDYSFVVRQHNAYVFAEYFHNDWGVKDLPASIAALPDALAERLGRGELFNLMRDYVAVGGSYEWHPLVNQTLTLISNLHDSSTLAQMQVSYSPGDHQSLEVGWIEPLGAAGDEFGGVPVLDLGFGQTATTGGASRFYLRWVYFF